MANSQQKKHVAVFIFPFGSHPIPLLNLVLKLADFAPNLQFSFIGTQHSNEPLVSKPNIPNNIKFYTISDGVPQGHVPCGHPVERVNLFLQACPANLQKGIDLAVEETKERVTCIIADAFVTSSLTVAQNLNVPWIPVWPPLSCSLSGSFYDGFRIKVLPHVTATGNVHKGIIAGKLNGQMPAQTPSGSLML